MPISAMAAHGGLRSIPRASSAVAGRGQGAARRVSPFIGAGPCEINPAVSLPQSRRNPMSFSLPELPYAHDALAPYMSRETLEYHHDKHHLAYVNNGNNLAKGTEWENKSVEEIVKGTFGKNQGLFNNAGQHYNHIHFWKWMKPGGGGDKIPGELEKKITADLGSVANMKEEFIQAGVTQFGSGWCWLAVKDGKIVVMKTLNGENPLVQGGKPILGCDVWEHSYYIDYRNRRPDYLKAFVDHLVNWDYVAEMYRAAAKYIGMAFSNLVAIAIIVTTAATLHVHGITNIQTSSQAA
jgi:Fe-Mn family superoxide dismutase